jgi:predicted transposase/invertase (TIGR01784 family)
MGPKGKEIGRFLLFEGDNERDIIYDVPFVCPRQAESEAPAMARVLVARTKTEIIYKLPRLSREEIQAMLQVHDIRETRVYQEAKDEGLKEGIDEGVTQERQKHLQEQLQSIARMAARKVPAEDIAEFLGLDVAVVRAELAKNQS